MGSTITPLRILVADDHDVIRHGVKAMLQAHEDWEVCGEANTGREAIAKAQALKPDIVILDIGMPEINGLEAARRIRTASAKSEILILSVHYSDQLVREIVDAGVHGFVVKSDSERDLIIAVESLGKHTPYFSAKVNQAILDPFKTAGPLTRVPELMRSRLTAREREIVRLLAEGKSSREAAPFLGISVKTVETHRANIMRKLEIHSVTELVLYALRNRITDP